MGYFLGLDSSTQSLSALVIDTDTGAVALDAAVNFGKDLPQYESPQGVLPNADSRICHSDPLMWAEAVDLLLQRVKDSGFDWSKVEAISGAGQQHGSVFLNRSLRETGRWSPDADLKSQLEPWLSYPTSPMWMDSSTARQCEEIAAAVGGQQAVVSLTGSRTIERFTGPQIRKIFQQAREQYERTAEIHLVSSLMASLLANTAAPIDLGDGAGMNLLELATGQWHRGLLDATAPGLGEKLPAPAPSSTVVGPIAPYFVERYGFSPEAQVVAFTGDNPSSLVGMAGIAPGTRLISLGTSDTVFAAMDGPRTDPRGFGHVFGNPAGGFMSLICFSNGSLAREAVAQRFELDWARFESAILRETKPGNGGNFMLPFFAPETTPRLADPKPQLFGSPDFVAWKSPAAAVRAVVEAQALSMHRYSDWIGHVPERLLLTGGASRNAAIRRVIADVFQTPVQVLEVANASALGGALRAAQAVGGHDFDALFARFVKLDRTGAVEPNAAAAPAYAELRERYDEKLRALAPE